MKAIFWEEVSMFMITVNCEYQEIMPPQEITYWLFQFGAILIHGIMLGEATSYDVC